MIDKEKTEITFTDRYAATGTPYPDENSCNECEGMGLHPVRTKDINRRACESPEGKLLVIGQKEKDGSPAPDDGWLFVQCPICHGSRKKPHE